MQDDAALADSLNGSVTYEINISSTPNLLLYSMLNDQVITYSLEWSQKHVALFDRHLQHLYIRDSTAVDSAFCKIVCVQPMTGGMP